MIRGSERLAVAMCWGLMCGCAPSSGNDVGRAQMSPTALGSSGRLYRLRAGTIDVSGPSVTSFSTETDPTATKVSLELKVGDHQATLEPGWYLEGAVATTPPALEIVDAVLSCRPAPAARSMSAGTANTAAPWQAPPAAPTLREHDQRR